MYCASVGCLRAAAAGKPRKTADVMQYKNVECLILGWSQKVYRGWEKVGDTSKYKVDACARRLRIQ